MIKTLLIILLFALTSAGGLYLGPHIAANKGYVLIAWENYTIEMTAISAAFMVIGVWVSLWIAKKLIKLLVRTLMGSTHWFSGMTHRRLQNAFRSGLLALNEGDLALAQAKLKKAKGANFSGLNYLALAQVELQLGNEDKAIEAWQYARNNEESAVAASVQLARHYLAQSNADEAILVLTQLSTVNQRNTQVIEQYAQALAQKKQWSTLSSKLNKEWKKHLSKAALEKWKEHEAHGIYAEIASKEGAYRLKEMWEKQARKVRLDPAHQAAYIKQLIAQSMHQDAETALVTFQKKSAVTNLLPLFKTLRLPNPTASLKLVESWLKKDSENSEFLSILGHLAYQARDFELAEKVLMKAMSLRDSRDDTLLLAKVKENQHDSKSALQLYKQCTFS